MFSDLSLGSAAEWEQFGVRRSGVEWSGVELLPAIAAEQAELWRPGSARGGAQCFKGGGDEEATALSMRLLVCAPIAAHLLIVNRMLSRSFSGFNPRLTFAKVYI